MACVTGDFRALVENEGHLATKMRSKPSRNFSLSLRRSSKHPIINYLPREIAWTIGGRFLVLPLSPPLSHSQSQEPWPWSARACIAIQIMPSFLNLLDPPMVKQSSQGESTGKGVTEEAVWNAWVSHSHNIFKSVAYISPDASGREVCYQYQTPSKLPRLVSSPSAGVEISSCSLAELKWGLVWDVFFCSQGVL